MDRRRFLIAGSTASIATLAEGSGKESLRNKPEHEALLSKGEERASIVAIDSSFPTGDPRRYGAAGDGLIDDTSSVANCFKTLQQGMLQPNPRLTFSIGQYRIKSTQEVPNSASQFEIVGSSRPRATQLLWDGQSDAPLLRLTNSRDVLFSSIGFDRKGTASPSHCVLQDRDNQSQIGTGGVGHIQYRDCRFAHAGIGLEIAQSGWNTNDNNSFYRCEFAGNTDLGLYLSNSNAAWTDINECRFYSNRAADVSNAVLQGQRRGGSFTARQCRHVLGDVAYEIGASRSISIIAPRIEQQSCFIRTSDSIVTTTAISASSELNSFVITSGSLPPAEAGDRIWVRGFKDNSNNGIFNVVRRFENRRLQVAETLACEPDGRKVKIASTKVRRSMHERGVHVMVFGGEIYTNGEVSLLFDGDTPHHVLTMVNCDYQAINGRFEFPGAATINIIGGTYGLSEIRFNGRLNLIATVQAAKSIRLTNLGSGRLDAVNNIGGGLNPTNPVVSEMSSNELIEFGNHDDRYVVDHDSEGSHPVRLDGTQRPDLMRIAKTLSTLIAELRSKQIIG